MGLGQTQVVEHVVVNVFGSVCASESLYASKHLRSSTRRKVDAVWLRLCATVGETDSGNNFDQG